jgi:dolichol-phosphate mannosyltransferase
MQVSSLWQAPFSLMSYRSGSKRRSLLESGLDSSPVDHVTELDSPWAARQLAVVVPTLNERSNVVVLVGLLHAVLAGIEWEVVFVDDDSRDGTADVARRLAQSDPRVRCIQRIGRRGLSSACIEGILATSAPVVAVMDADLQHDETLLPRMYAALAGGDLDIVVASRYVAGGSVGEGLDKRRALISAVATRLSRLVVKSTLADPMSGFFMLRREAFNAAVRNLSGQGFKILLDLFASSPRPLRFRELAFTFRERQFGESKLDSMVAWEYLMLIGDKLIGHVIPVRFVLFALIGAIGVGVNLLVLSVSLDLGLRFATAETVATLAAMVCNFLLNNKLTYRDRRLRGLMLVRGLVTFCVGCSIGAVANIGISAQVFGQGQSWWLAGLAGALIGAVWNYAIASTYTWGRAK